MSERTRVRLFSPGYPERHDGSEQRPEGPRRLGHRRRADDRREEVLPRDAGRRGRRAGARRPQQGRRLEEDRRAAGPHGSRRLSPRPVGWPAVRRLLRAIGIDAGPLRRHRDFRLLVTGQGISFAGSMLTAVAVPFQVYALTESTLAVGLLGLAEIVPLLATALLGGALADAHDRRRLVIVADCVLLVFALLLLGNALLADPHLWLLYVAAAGTSAAGGLQPPPLDAILPRLVPRDELPAASAIDGFIGNAGQIGGPPPPRAPIAPARVGG